jgi:hypothetical protein
MTPRAYALLLRLAAATLTAETRSIIVLRRTLGSLGWTEAALDAGVASATAAVRGVAATQTTMEMTQ